MVDFEKELTVLINKCSMENDSDTPDYILADYLKQCLVTFAKITKRRDVSPNYPMPLKTDVHMGLPIVHVVGETIVGETVFGTDSEGIGICNGKKCRYRVAYSPGLIRLDEIKIYSEGGLLLGVSDVEGNITDATEDQTGVIGRIDVDGNYSISFVAFPGLAGLTAKITYDYDYEYSLPEEVH